MLNEDLIPVAAAHAGLPLHVAYALLQMESNGANVFGSDAGGMFKGEAVTKAKYDTMVKAVAAGHASNGVGPTQITWPGYFPDAKAKGYELWDPLSNMKYGFKLLAFYAHLGWQEAGARYNGKTSYGKTFARRVDEWKLKLEVPTVAKVTWRGKKFDSRTRDMLVELDRLVGPKIQILPTQGSYSTGTAASAGTHAGGGACDLSVAELTADQIKLVVFLARRVGFAAWHRLPSEGDWGAHIHMIACECDDLSPSAERQVTSYRIGKSGLASNKADKHKALGAPVTVWEAYKK